MDTVSFTINSKILLICLTSIFDLNIEKIRVKITLNKCHLRNGYINTMIVAFDIKLIRQDH